MIKAKVFITIVSFACLINLNQEVVKIDSEKINKPIKASLAISGKERAKGLSGQKTLKNNEGLLFVYEDLEHPSIWMKDMNFAIDIIWLSESKKIIDYKKNVSPSTYPESFKPKKPAKYVLEVNAGFIEKNELKIDDKLNFEL